MLRDSKRVDHFQGGGENYREVSVTVWYPTTNLADSPRADYLAPEIAQRLAEDLLDNDVSVFDVKTHAHLGPPVAKGRHSVVLFSPGFGYPSAMYSSLVEDMASHGYVVVTVDHPYVSGPMRRLDGSWATTEGLDPELIFTSSHVVVDDLRFVLDWLAAQNADANHPLGGRLDMQRVGTYGHSYGGSAALQLARSDARVLASVSLDSSVFGDISGSWDIPFLLLRAQAPQDGSRDPTIDALWSVRGPAAERMELAGMEHNSFTDTKYLLGLRKAVPPELAVQLDIGHGDANKEMANVRQLARDFLGRYLR